ncbi:MAG: sensor histidine kinase [Chloroflexi bacterium]|nr:sensor histidine kinase [Chloroflexota bacterium]
MTSSRKPRDPRRRDPRPAGAASAANGPPEDAPPGAAGAGPAFARWIEQNREGILAAWGSKVRADGLIESDRSLSHHEFVDHVPLLLAEICRVLGGASLASEHEEIVEDAALHGIFRWKQGYDLVELIREMRHLRTTLHDALARFADQEPVPREAERSLVAVVTRVLELAQVGTILSYLGQRDTQNVELQRARVSALTEAVSIKADFLGVLAHELRTPLQAVVGWTKLLRSVRVDDPLHARALRVIEQNTKLLVQLIEDLQDLSRAAAGELGIRREPLDAREVVGAALDTVAPAAADRRVELRYDRPPSPLPVLGDRRRLQQILWNLLSNAVKFSPTGAEVVVEAARAEDGVRITVRDRGTGIDPTFLPHVFDRYRQGGSGDAGPEGGVGLGLSIVRELAGLHGGSVHAESAGRGHGAVFTLVLPLHEEPPGRTEAGA